MKYLQEVKSTFRGFAARALRTDDNSVQVQVRRFDSPFTNVKVDPRKWPQPGEAPGNVRSRRFYHVRELLLSSDPTLLRQVNVTESTIADVSRAVVIVTDRYLNRYQRGGQRAA